MTTPAAAGDAGSSSLEVRPPVQRRSKEAWSRVLDAGVSLLENGGYDAFTIAAVCERAQVAPRALYDRVDNKDALFLAVYEHGLARVRRDHARLADEARWRDVPPEQVAVEGVREVARIFSRHAPLLRAVVLISGVHEEVHRRGGRYSQELGDLFTALLLGRGAQVDQPDPEDAVRAAFHTVFSTLVMRTAYGPTFGTPAREDEAFVDALGTMVRRYLYDC